ncbi:hypothetical protein U1Q18_017880 [Sarracenia purpurea var. burkii]
MRMERKKESEKKKGIHDNLEVILQGKSMDAKLDERIKRLSALRLGLKSSCESERSNGAGISVGKEVCAPEPVVDGKGGKLDSDMVAQTSRAEGVDLDTIREAPLVAQGHSTGTETGKIEDEPFLDAPIFGDEVIKLAGTHVDLEKREHEVA